MIKSKNVSERNIVKFTACLFLPRKKLYPLVRLFYRKIRQQKRFSFIKYSRDFCSICGKRLKALV